VTGQGVIGSDCAWCGLPAVGEVEVRPAEYRSLGRVDPIIGDRGAYQQLVHAPIVVPVCDEHAQIKSGQPAPVPIPRQRTAKGVEQLGMFACTEQERVRNAIYRETGR
jgi:hypothetical protein